MWVQIQPKTVGRWNERDKKIKKIDSCNSIIVPSGTATWRKYYNSNNSSLKMTNENNFNKIFIQLNEIIKILSVGSVS